MSDRILMLIEIYKKSFKNIYLYFINILIIITNFILQIAVALLAYILAILVLVFISTLAMYAFGELTRDLGLDEQIKAILQKISPDISTSLQHLMSSYGNDYASDLILTILGLLIGLIILSLFKDEKGLIILPFDVGGGIDKYLGKAISDRLLADLSDISRIHQLDPKYLKLMEERPTERANIVSLLDYKKGEWPEILPSSMDLYYSIGELGTVGNSSFSLQLGQLLIFLRRISPIRSSGSVVHGSLQNYGSELSLVAHIKRREVRSLEIHRDAKACSPGIQIPRMVRDMAFQIAFMIKPRKTVSTATLRGFKYFTDAKKAYYQYTQTEELNELEQARVNCLVAAIAEQKNESFLELLTAIYIAYFNKKIYSEIERIFRQIVLIKSNDDKALRMWGMALRRLGLYEEAIKCYDNAIEINKTSAETWLNKGISHRHLKNYHNYHESIACFKHAEDILWESAWHKKVIEKILGISQAKRNLLALAWVNKGIAYEFLCDKQKAIECYEKALQFDDKLTSVYSMLARLYSNKNNEKYEENCKNARKNIKKTLEYSQACFQAICSNDKDEVIRLLRLALDKKQALISWVTIDPDLNALRSDPQYGAQFEALIKEFSDVKKNAKDEISKAAIFRKLGNKSKFDDQCKTISSFIEKEDEHIRARFSVVRGESDKALELLRIALKKKQVNTAEIHVDPDFEIIRDDPRLQTLLSEFDE